MSDKMRLARNLRMARVAARMTQIAAASLVGKSRQTINAWEREDEDSASPDDGDLDLLASAYGTTRAALRYGEIGPIGIYTDAGVANQRVSEPAPGRQALSASIREFLAHSQLEMVKAGALEDEVSEAMDLLKSPQIFTFYQGGAPHDFTEEQVLMGMRAIYRGVIKPELKKRGRKL